MPHRRKNIETIYEGLLKKKFSRREVADAPSSLSFTSDKDSCQAGASNDTHSSVTIECFHCQEVFASPLEIQKHMLEKHVRTETAKNVLENDGLLFQSTASIAGRGGLEENNVSISSCTNRKRKQLEKSSDTDQRPSYVCEDCDFSALTPAALAIHRKTHGDPETRHKCHLCDFSSKCFPDLAKHGEECHKLENGLFQCTVCSKSFETYTKARRHVWMTHVDMNVVCQECGKKFFRMDRLRKHISSTHCDTPVGHCFRCGKGFRRKDKLKDHEEICLRKSENAAATNRKSTSGASQPVTEKKRPGPKCVASTLEPTPDDAYCRFPFRCDLCRVGFKNHDDLLIHAEARHRNQIIPIVLPMVDVNQQISQQESYSVFGQQYCCSFCQVTWSSMVEMKLHVALDHPEKKDDSFKYECPFCMPALGRNYPARDRLVRHLRRQHRQLLTPLMRSNSCTNDQDVASHVEIGIPRSSVRSRKMSLLPSSVGHSTVATPVPVASELSCSTNQFMSPLPAMDYQQLDCVPVLTDNSFTPVMPSDGVCQATSPNFFSCGSLADLSALEPADAPYSGLTAVHQSAQRGSHRIGAMSPVAVTHSHMSHPSHETPVYDASSMVCFADPISGLVNGQGCQDATTDAPYLLAASPLPLPTSVLTACFDSPLTGPLNSHAYQLLE